MVVDLPSFNCYDLRKLPLVRRRSRLKKLIAKTAIQFSESFAVDGPEMYKHACSPGSTGGFKGPRQPLSRRPRQ
jgi:bifunctional non-homologous end joining protein LigD